MWVIFVLFSRSGGIRHRCSCQGQRWSCCNQEDRQGLRTQNIRQTHPQIVEAFEAFKARKYHQHRDYHPSEVSGRVRRRVRCLRNDGYRSDSDHQERATSNLRTLQVLPLSIAQRPQIHSFCSNCPQRSRNNGFIQKPRNLLVNSNCDLKICDFGLARPLFHNLKANVLT